MADGLFPARYTTGEAARLIRACQQGPQLLPAPELRRLQTQPAHSTLTSARVASSAVSNTTKAIFEWRFSLKGCTWTPPSLMR